MEMDNPPEVESFMPVVVVSVAFLLGVAALAYVIQRNGGDAAYSMSLNAYGNLLGCFCGLCVCFVSYGIFQEHIMTQKYGGESFPSSIALVFANRSLALCLLPPIILYRREKLFWEGCHWCLFPAITLVISSWCQHESLRFVSFPTQVVFKSSKIVPTMLVSWILLRKVYGARDYMMAFIVTAATAGFTLSMETSDEQQATVMLGVGMMCLFLLCDALTSNGEKRIYTQYPDTSPLQMFFVMAIFSWGLSAASLHGTDGFGPVTNFLLAHPNCLFHVTGLSIAACAGQVLIFYIVKQHGPVVFSVMMTIRQMISVITSAIIFHHAIGWMAAVCAMVVFGAVFLQSYLTHLAHSAKEGKVQKNADEEQPLAKDAQKAESFGAAEKLVK